MKSGETITSADIDDTSRFPCHGGNGLRGFTNRFTHSGRFALIGRQGALCGNVRGVSGQFFASEHAVVVTAFPQTDVGWLTYMLGEMRLNQYSESSAQPGLSIAKLLLLDVACPSTKAEQRAIAAVLSDVDELIGSLEALIAKKRAIKRAAMQELLTGRTRLPGFGGGWEVVSLDEVTSRTTGYWGTSKPTHATPHSVRVIRAGDISPRGTLTGYAPRHFSQAELDKASCALSDVVVTVSGNGLGKTWLVDRRGMAGSNFVRILRAVPDRATGAFVAFSLRSATALEQLAEHTATSAYPNLLPSFFSASWFPLPPLPEQRAIAAVLSDMDAEVAALEHRLDKTRAIKQGMMQQLLTGAIRLPIPDTTPHENAEP